MRLALAFRDPNGAFDGKNKGRRRGVKGRIFARIRPVYGAPRAASRTTGPHGFARAGRAVAHSFGRRSPAQNRYPHRRFAAAGAVLDPARAAPGTTPVLWTIRRRKMAIEQQIEELRAELSGCDEAGERARIAAELDAARAQLAALGGCD